MKEHLVSCGPAVNESEPKAFGPLMSCLVSGSDNEEWFSLANLAFSAKHHHRSDEIGIVAVGPPGDRVIEQEANRLTNKARKIGTMQRKRVRPWRRRTACSGPRGGFQAGGVRRPRARPQRSVPHSQDLARSDRVPCAGYCRRSRSGYRVPLPSLGASSQWMAL